MDLTIPQWSMLWFGSQIITFTNFAMIPFVLACFNFTCLLFSLRTALNKTKAVPMENNTSVKEANKEVIVWNIGWGGGGDFTNLMTLAL